MQRIMKEGIRALLYDKKKKNYAKYEAPLPKKHSNPPKKKVPKIKDKQQAQILSKVEATMPIIAESFKKGNQKHVKAVSRHFN